MISAVASHRFDGTQPIAVRDGDLGPLSFLVALGPPDQHALAIGDVERAQFAPRERRGRWPPGVTQTLWELEALVKVLEEWEAAPKA